jgi:hypothetical protein
MATKNWLTTIWEYKGLPALDSQEEIPENARLFGTSDPDLLFVAT